MTEAGGKEVWFTLWHAKKSRLLAESPCFCSKLTADSCTLTYVEYAELKRTYSTDRSDVITCALPRPRWRSMVRLNSGCFMTAAACFSASGPVPIPLRPIDI